MQSNVGFIITKELVNTPTNTTFFGMNFVKRTTKAWTYPKSNLRSPVSVPLPNPPMIRNNPPKLYEVKLRSGTMHLLAPDSEQAAWMALELSHERNDELLDVRQADEW